MTCKRASQPVESDQSAQTNIWVQSELRAGHLAQSVQGIPYNPPCNSLNPNTTQVLVRHPGLIPSLVVFLNMVYSKADNAKYSDEGPIRAESSRIPPNSLSWHPISCPHSVKNYCAADGTALSVRLVSVEEQSVGHRTSSPSASKHPNQPVPGASFVSFLWVAHILSPQWSLFQLHNKRLYQTQR